MAPHPSPAIASRPSGASALATAIATITANLYLIFGSSLLGLAAIVASFIPPRRRYGFHVARAWCTGLLLAS